LFSALLSIRPKLPKSIIRPKVIRPFRIRPKEAPPISYSLITCDSYNESLKTYHNIDVHIRSILKQYKVMYLNMDRIPNMAWKLLNTRFSRKFLFLFTILFFNIQLKI
jgi:hypothetical protein